MDMLTLRGRAVRWLALIAIAGGVVAIFVPANRTPPLRVGLLHSASGTMASSEAPVMRATLLAIDELNAQGGLLGRRIQPLIADGQSDDAVFAREAERLILQEHVATLFGCWTSACRKSLLPVVEQHEIPLFYPLQHEGIEASPYIVYCGSTPNQQILPAVDWAVEHLGKRVFLIGSDYIFPRVANQLIRDHLALTRATVLGEEYLPLGSARVAAIVKEIVQVKPDVILNTINGETNVFLVRALREAGVTSKQIPIVSFSIAEAELQHAGVANFVGDYAAWSYFQSLAIPANQAFVDRYRRRYGADQVTDDPMESAYVSVLLWAAAVRSAGTESGKEVMSAIRSQSVDAPEGLVYVDPHDLHVWKTPRLGQIRADGQFEVVWSDRLLRAVPFPVGRTLSEWSSLIGRLRSNWSGAWSAPTGL